MQTPARLRDGEGLLGFVEDEFQNLLRCGWLAGGFARFRCGGCGVLMLVFTCLVLFRWAPASGGATWRKRELEALLKELDCQ